MSTEIFHKCRELKEANERDYVFNIFTVYKNLELEDEDVDDPIAPWYNNCVSHNTGPALGINDNVYTICFCPFCGKDLTKE